MLLFGMSDKTQNAINHGSSRSIHLSWAVFTLVCTKRKCEKGLLLEYFSSCERRKKQVKNMCVGAAVKLKIQHYPKKLNVFFLVRVQTL